MNQKALLTAAFFLSTLWLLAQVPIVPIWVQLVPSVAHDTRLAMDHEADRLHLALKGSSADPRTHILAFGTDGTAVAPPFDELVLGSVEQLFAMTDMPLRLTAESDTLHYVENLQRYDVDFFTNVNRAGSISLDSTSVFNVMVNGWYETLTDIHHDSFGELVSSLTNLRSFTKSHWLLGRISIPNTDRIAANQHRVYCGRLPSIAVVEREQMTQLTSITVLSSGTSTRTLLMLTNDAIHYASVNSNSTMDIGAVDTMGTAIWNTILNLSQPTILSGIVTDAMGNFWVAGSQSGAFPTGVLYRFSAAGIQTGNYTYGRTIDDIVCSGDTVFLSGWDAVDQSMVYLAAFDTDITTSLPLDRTNGLSISPNPANDLLYLHGSASWTEGTIVDATGKTALSITQAQLSSGSVAISELAEGSYLLVIRNAKTSARLPFVIAR